MQSRNVYRIPIEEEFIKAVITEKSPAHIKYTDADGTKYDLTRAIDYLCDEGTSVHAVYEGEVVKIQNKVNKTYPLKDFKNIPIEERDGNYIMIKHPNNEFSIYSHLSEISVKKGERVKKGDIIGKSGNTGPSRSPHLHFMVFLFNEPYPSRDLTSLEITWE